MGNDNGDETQSLWESGDKQRRGGVAPPLQEIGFV
jgi:hypothetical protein